MATRKKPSPTRKAPGRGGGTQPRPLEPPVPGLRDPITPPEEPVVPPRPPEPEPRPDPRPPPGPARRVGLKR
jgi:hypothetical protein